MVNSCINMYTNMNIKDDLVIFCALSLHIDDYSTNVECNGEGGIRPDVCRAVDPSGTFH